MNRLMAYEQTPAGTDAIKVEQFAYLVKRIAHHLAVRMPASVQLDDLLQAGMLGLLEAARKYDGARGASFETYAGIRIRGAMVDEMRRGDWVPRSVHRNARRIVEAMNTVAARLGRDATDAEVAEEMEVPLEQYHAMANDSVAGRLFSYDEAVDDGDDYSAPSTLSEPLRGPAETAQRQGMRQALANAIETLTEREQLVLSLYYDEELNLKEIGQILEVSESRVCQIHAQAALRLKKKLGDWQGSS